MPSVVLLFDDDCPNVDLAREQLRLAFEQIGVAPHWREHLLDSPDLPEHARGYGSPTILVDGKDVTGSAPSNSRCCRVYQDAEGAFRRAPSAEKIVTALCAAGSEILGS